MDTCGEVGDAAVSYPGLAGKVAPTSLLTGSFIINSLVCRVVELFLGEGLTPPVYLSANLPGATSTTERWERSTGGVSATCETVRPGRGWG